ncbi:hypothetical protein ACG74X_15365 [Marivita sp. S0852]|uniref:hypothetical protein n=1 Tax=Marivita sp. S0852 TaxID=3373893 RepID=UPI003982B3B4
MQKSIVKIFVKITFIVFTCSKVAAMSGVARSEEFNNFTRITVATNEVVEGVSVKQLESKIFVIEVNNKLVDIDIRSMFAEQSAKRVSNLFLRNGNLVLELNCKCELFAYMLNQDAIVLDISNRVESSSFLSSNQGRKTNVGLAYNFKDNSFVSSESIRQIAASISMWLMKVPLNNRNASISKGLIADYQSVSFIGNLPYFKDNSNINRINKCKFETALWQDMIKNPSLGQRVEYHDGYDSILEDSYEELFVRQYMLKGRFEEILLYLEIQEQKSSYHQEVKRLIYNILDRQSFLEKGGSQSCSPISSFVTAVHGSVKQDFVTDIEMLTLIENFFKFPIGWQLYLYPKLVKVGEVNKKPTFASLERQRQAELSLPNLFGDISYGEDQQVLNNISSDQLNAVSNELLGTVHYDKSFAVTFKSYLTSGRYFDALAFLEGWEGLNLDKKVILINQFFEHITSYAEVSVFLHIVVEEFPLAGEDVSSEVKRQIYARLVTDGFTAAASNFAQMFLDSDVNPTSSFEGSGNLTKSISTVTAENPIAVEESLEQMTSLRTPSEVTAINESSVVLESADRIDIPQSDLDISVEIAKEIIGHAGEARDRIRDQF